MMKFFFKPVKMPDLSETEPNKARNVVLVSFHTHFSISLSAMLAATETRGFDAEA